jgi:hypothetical protein
MPVHHQYLFHVEIVFQKKMASKAGIYLLIPFIGFLFLGIYKDLPSRKRVILQAGILLLGIWK